MIGTLTVLNVCPRRWAKRYGLSERPVKCLSCGSDTPMNIAFAVDGLRGLRAADCRCGDPRTPFTVSSYPREASSPKKRVRSRKKGQVFQFEELRRNAALRSPFTAAKVQGALRPLRLPTRRSVKPGRLQSDALQDTLFELLEEVIVRSHVHFLDFSMNNVAPRKAVEDASTASKCFISVSKNGTRRGAANSSTGVLLFFGIFPPKNGPPLGRTLSDAQRTFRGPPPSSRVDIRPTSATSSAPKSPSSSSSQSSHRSTRGLPERRFIGCVRSRSTTAFASADCP
ncbi:hypothetical protein OUZ56_032645 [Daphnia magna]|uniref:Uncharacterized protein n=1 Tax=Daphnia magna TaxID=35525 RepID=A0ABR0B9I2_9CRUS|nr:hypothetical protein OUZ56_032645 [Daphnia magna]